MARRDHCSFRNRSSIRSPRMGAGPQTRTEQDPGKDGHQKKLSGFDASLTPSSRSHCKYNTTYSSNLLNYLLSMCSKSTMCLRKNESSAQVFQRSLFVRLIFSYSFVSQQVQVCLFNYTFYLLLTVCNQTLAL